MTAVELVNQLRRLNFTLAADNDQLIVKGPKEALTPALRAQLSELKIEILKLLKDAAPRRPAVLRRVSRDKDLCLSFPQQRLWFLDQLEPGKSIYNVSGALRLRGRLDREALRRSLEEIVRRHEALRTTFSMTEAGPVQVISPAPQFTLLREDIHSRSEEAAEEELRRGAAAEAARPFDLTRGPLFRATLIRVDTDDHALLLTMHHIVSDGWSMGILYRELSVLYRAFVKGEASPLAELPIQYADFAMWQREWLEREELDRQLGYWKKQLGGIPALLDLRTDRARPAIQSFRGKTQSVVLGKELTEALKALNRQEGVTLFMTLLAALQTLLYRHTGQEDIVVGSPIANRNRIEIEGLIGFFVNTLVLRASFGGDPTFREFLSSVRRNALDAYEHQDLPFEKLVEELKPHRTLSYTPLFQVMLVLQNTPDAAVSLEGLSVSRVRTGSETAKFDLTLSVSETPEGLRTSLQYNTDLFEDATIARLLAHFEILLRGIVHDPSRRVSELPLITEAESRDLIARGQIKKRYEKDRCLHQLFEEQARRTPQAVALVFEDQQWSYGELNACANSLARTLRGLGVRPDVRVGLCTERSPELIIGILAILKAGGAYVPLDPSYPKQRIEFILEDSDISLLVTQKHLAADLPAGDWSTVLVDARELRNFSPVAGDAELTETATPDNLAYVIYTSGSTGRPKGVMIPHGAAHNHMKWIVEEFSLNSGDRVAQRSPFSFDASVWEIFAPLMCGAQLVIAPPQACKDPEGLIEFIEKQKISVLQVVPALLQMLVAEGLGRCTSLRRVFCGGEALSSELYAQFRRQVGATLTNLYGPTEATIDATFYTPEGDCDQSWLPIGRPIANTEVYILDAQLNPMPVGVAGELYIGGAGLARGYLNQPELTAERFIDWSFNGRPITRLYKTGDRGRYLSDGNIEFLGRMDHQVKVRGFRIELGEIESVLRQHPGVREAAALVRGTDVSERSVVAYIELRKEAPLAGGELRSFLKERLPEYMMPAAFVLVDRFPLTANGKLDRNALPEPDPGRRESAAVYLAPRNSTEQLLADIWADVLKVGQVGIHDNFFELGGHSLLAVRVVSRMREALQKNIPLRSLFEAPTIGELGLLIERNHGSQNAAQVRPIARAERESYRIKLKK